MQSAFSFYKKQSFKKAKNSTVDGGIKKKSAKKQNGFMKKNSKNALKKNEKKMKLILQESDSWTETRLNNSIDEDELDTVAEDVEADLKDSVIKIHDLNNFDEEDIADLSDSAEENGDVDNSDEVNISDLSDAAGEDDLNNSNEEEIETLIRTGTKTKSVKAGSSISKKSTSLSNNTTQSLPKDTFRWIIAPYEPEQFMALHWERQPVHIHRDQEYYQSLFTTEKLDKILRENSLFYGRNVDVVSYVDGVRETFNPEGRAIPCMLWDYYNNGCSIRILNPQTYSNKLHSLLANLQEHFGCMAGMNVYLTPPGSQGFAPHYDDIEAFVLQLEGRKHWTLYEPLDDNEVLPRLSSHNLERDKLGRVIKSLTLEAGDILYFPRGVIHEGRTDDKSHSLHITVSVYQKTAYVDLLEHLLKPALAKAAKENIEFRRGLPLNYLKHVGMVNVDKQSQTRDEIVSTVKSLLNTAMSYISIDAAADQLGKKMMWDVMPPIPTKEEKRCMMHEDGETLLAGKVIHNVEFTLDIKIRLLRYYSIRVVEEEDDGAEESTIRLYYSTENAKVYHEEEQQFLLVDETQVAAFKCLLNNYPNFVKAGSLPFKNDNEKITFVGDLWERGLLVTHKPLKRLK